MTKTGWCVANQHEGRVLKYGNNCPRVFFGGKECSCDCHKPKESRFKSRRVDQK